MIRRLAVFAFFLLSAIPSFPATAADPAVGEAAQRAAFEEEWSMRLMQAQARVDRARKRQDEANAAYARAVAKGEDELVITSFEKRRQAATAELADAEKMLPILVEDAREEGIPEAVLKPYRFAVSPAGAP